MVALLMMRKAAESISYVRVAHRARNEFSIAAITLPVVHAVGRTTGVIFLMIVSSCFVRTFASSGEGSISRSIIHVVISASRLNLHEH